MWFWENQSLFLLLNTEKMQIMPNTNFIVFGLTWQGLDSTIYHTRGEHASHYTTGVVDIWYGRKSNTLMTASQKILYLKNNK
jgi:hypothetical protein